MSLAIELKKVGKTFFGADGEEVIFKDLSLGVAPGSWLSICGRSGVGKTTLLRMIAGLEGPNFGEVWVAGQHPSKNYPRIGYVVQDYNSSLLPWRNAQANVSLALLNIEKNKTRREELAKQALERVGLGDSLKKLPWQLSGGMKQRVAIARALVVNPVIMLLDEPFTSLDPTNREQLRELVMNLAKEDKFTTVFVTHDLEEAIFTSDQILLLPGSGQPELLEEVDIESAESILELRSAPKFQTLYGKLRLKLQ